MDIEGEEGNERAGSGNRSTSLNANRWSYKSRKSNESCFSIGGTHYHPDNPGDMQKISLESDISTKAREKFNNHDLFENLAYSEPYNYEMRDEGSFKSKQRCGEGEKKLIMVQEEKMSVEPYPVEKPLEVSCKCPKSKCLLMYCECFSKDIQCNEKCTCYQCRNNPDFEDKRQKARNSVLEKDPDAFRNKVERVGSEFELALKKGCNCKKTNCAKKYCECFYTGVKCSYLCNCENCHNGSESIAQP